MRRVMGSVEREPDGSWIIAADHLERAAAYEARQLRDRPVKVEMLSPVPLDRLPRADAATWLDRELVAERARACSRLPGSGARCARRRRSRRQWLMAEGLAEKPGWRSRLSRTEWSRRFAGASCSGSPDSFPTNWGSPFVEAKPGERIEGTSAPRR